ncbi:hypothetical protein Hamer_G007368, partial [Homarus americanus]
EGSNRTQKPPSPQLPHVTCPQPLAFVGFLKDMLDVLSIQMNFTHAVSFPRVSTSYGGAGMSPHCTPQ